MCRMTLLADSVFDKDLLSGPRMVPSFCVLTWWMRWGSFFVRTLIPFTRASLSRPPKNPIPWGPHTGHSDFITEIWGGYPLSDHSKVESMVLISLYLPFCLFLKTGMRLRPLGKCHINYITGLPCKHPLPPISCKCILTLTQHEYWVETQKGKVQIEQIFHYYPPHGC